MLEHVRNQRILLDSNLSVLFCIGSLNREYIVQHKRLKAYDEVDFDILREITLAASEVIVTPYSLAEASNLLKSKNGFRYKLGIVFHNFVLDSVEEHIASNQSVMHPYFTRLGLTDANLLKILEKNRATILLSADSLLCDIAKATELNAIKFAKIQDMRPDFN